MVTVNHSSQVSMVLRKFHFLLGFLDGEGLTVTRGMTFYDLFSFIFGLYTDNFLQH